jgi:hypothetical protein
MASFARIEPRETSTWPEPWFIHRQGGCGLTVPARPTSDAAVWYSLTTAAIDSVAEYAEAAAAINRKDARPLSDGIAFGDDASRFRNMVIPLCQSRRQRAAPRLATAAHGPAVPSEL